MQSQSDPIPWIVQSDGEAVGRLERDDDEHLFLQLTSGERIPISLDELRAHHDGTMLLNEPLGRLRERVTTPVVSSMTVPVAPVVPVAASAAISPSSPPPLPTMSKVTTSDEVTIPVVEETVHVEKQRTPIGSVLLHVVPQQRTERIEIPISTEHAEVRTVEVRQLVDEAPPVREEGDTVIVPVVEEVLVVHKRLMVREEIHIVRRRATHVQQQDVLLRSEKVEITRQKP